MRAHLHCACTVGQLGGIAVDDGVAAGGLALGEGLKGSKMAISGRVRLTQSVVNGGGSDVKDV